MKIVFVDKCENCPYLFFTEADCKYKCRAEKYKIIDTDQKIPEWCPLADMQECAGNQKDIEYINPKQGSTKMLQKFKCKYCGSTWFDGQPITECEFAVHSDSEDGEIFSAVTRGKSIYYRCMACSKLTRIHPLDSLSFLKVD